MDFATNIDFIDYIEVPPGVSIGTHQHGYNEEIYFIVEGSGTMSIEGKEYNVKSGDVIINKINGTHGLINHSSDDMKIFIFQVKQ
ncbi:cupin domain-containing protein [Paenibacillus sp. MAHUQ-46]|uniref:Cupin domain-containing protein n=1 Tax=Paenibacillus roseus TaxID=2798579 RepID=A0A934MQ68_9BACL|nr:cupin domain-containing protein [Paenibacillus roseus]